MRFERRTVERAGHFESLDIDLPGGPGLVVTYGPNRPARPPSCAPFTASGSASRTAFLRLRVTTTARSPCELSFGTAPDTPVYHPASRSARTRWLAACTATPAGPARCRTLLAQTPCPITEEFYRVISSFTHADLVQQGRTSCRPWASPSSSAAAPSVAAPRRSASPRRPSPERERGPPAKGKNPAINRGLTQLRDARLVPCATPRSPSRSTPR